MIAPHLPPIPAPHPPGLEGWWLPGPGEAPRVLKVVESTGIAHCATDHTDSGTQFPQTLLVKKSGYWVWQQRLQPDHRGQVHTEGALSLLPHFIVRGPLVHLEGPECQQL